MTVGVLTVVMVGMRVSRAIGMGMRMLVLVVRMGVATAVVVMRVAMPRPVGVHMPVFVVMAVRMFVNVLAFDARFARATATSGAHVSRSSGYPPSRLF